MGPKCNHTYLLGGGSDAARDKHGETNVNVGTEI